MNGVEIKKEMINSEGCRIDGIKTVFCDKMCEIKKCANENEYETCGNCDNLMSCGKVKIIIGSNKEVLFNLKNTNLYGK